MKFTKIIKASDEEIKQELQEILDKINAEKDLYMSEVVFLQSHKEDIKRLFPGEPILWQWADIPEEEWNNKKSSKNIKSGESYGWFVAPWEAQDKLDLWIETVGVDQALNDLRYAMGNDELSSNLAYIFRMNDFREGQSKRDGDDE